jgi:hypothetical protein
MPKIFDTSTEIDRTIRIFDSFYSIDLVVGANEYEIVHGYFLSVCATKNIADNFTALLFRVSQETGVNIMDLLESIQGKTKLQMNQTISYYLNSVKSKTSLYGVSLVPKPNQPVARNIVQ